MKIRVVEKDERTSIRMCEECKEQGKEGIFLTLAFFNGFICSGCGWTLDEALRNNLFNLPYEITPVLEEYDLDNPLLDPEPRIAITKKRWEEFKQMELDAIKKIQEESTVQPDMIHLGPQEPYYCACGAAGEHPKNIHDTERCDSPLAYDREPTDKFSMDDFNKIKEKLEERQIPFGTYGKPDVQDLMKTWAEFKQMELDAIKKIQEGSPYQETIQLGPPDAPTTRQDAPRTILGEEVTQKDWEELEDRYIALEAQMQELLDWKMEVGTNWYRLKNSLDDAETYMKKVEERFIG